MSSGAPPGNLLLCRRCKARATRTDELATTALKFRRSIAQLYGVWRRFAAVARIIDVPLDLQECPPLASYQMYFAVPIGWLARLWLWWGALRQRIVVCRGEPTNTDDELTIGQIDRAT